VRRRNILACYRRGNRIVKKKNFRDQKVFVFNQHKISTNQVEVILIFRDFQKLYFEILKNCDYASARTIFPTPRERISRTCIKPDERPLFFGHGLVVV